MLLLLVELVATGPDAVLASLLLRGGERDTARFEPVSLLSFATLLLRVRELELTNDEIGRIPRNEWPPHGNNDIHDGKIQVRGRNR